MKRIICAALALALLGSTAAQARGWHDGGGWHGRGGYHHGGGDAALGIGLGFLALGIIAAESAHDRDRYDRDERYTGRDDRGDSYRGDDRSRGYNDEGDAPRPLHQGNDRGGYDDNDD